MNFENFSKPEIKIDNKEKVLNNTYNLESGVIVKIKSKEIYPSNLENIDASKAIILLPGWEAGPEDKTTTALSKEFAESSSNITYVITAEADKSKIKNPKEIDFMYEEAKAISKFIKEHNLKEIKLAGYSIGGDSAMDIAHILQEDPNIKVDGIILLESTGLYDQKPREMVSNLLKDSFIKTPKNLLKNENTGSNFKQWFNVAVDINSNTVAKTLKSPSHIGKMIGRIKETSQLNKRAEYLKVPIVLINGGDDQVSDEKEIAPIEDGTGEEIRLREKYLKENIFKNSSYIRMIVADRLGNHGLPYFRSKAVAEASLYLLDRFNRDK